MNDKSIIDQIAEAFKTKEGIIRVDDPTKFDNIMSKNGFMRLGGSPTAGRRPQNEPLNKEIPE